MPRWNTTSQQSVCGRSRHTTCWPNTKWSIATRAPSRCCHVTTIQPEWTQQIPSCQINAAVDTCHGACWKESVSSVPCFDPRIIARRRHKDRFAVRREREMAKYFYYLIFSRLYIYASPSTANRFDFQDPIQRLNGFKIQLLDSVIQSNTLLTTRSGNPSISLHASTVTVAAFKHSKITDARFPEHYIGGGSARRRARGSLIRLKSWAKVPFEIFLRIRRTMSNRRD
jgi:hypothetical protein